MQFFRTSLPGFEHAILLDTGAQVGIKTDSSHTKAKIIDVSTTRIRKELAKGRIVIVAGFQGTNLDQEITTPGRGGSDMTAVALAKALKAEVCEIYTDVKGVYTADPRIVPSAKKLDTISYEEMLELASLGAQVMQARSVEVGSKFDVPIHVRSSFAKENGTMIIKEVKAMEDVLVRGVTANKNEAKVTVCDVPAWQVTSISKKRHSESDASLAGVAMKNMCLAHQAGQWAVDSGPIAQLVRARLISARSVVQFHSGPFFYGLSELPAYIYSNF